MRIGAKFCRDKHVSVSLQLHQASGLSLSRQQHQQQRRTKQRLTLQASQSARLRQRQLLTRVSRLPLGLAVLLARRTTGTTWIPATKSRWAATIISLSHPSLNRRLTHIKSAHVCSADQYQMSGVACASVCLHCMHATLHEGCACLCLIRLWQGGLTTLFCNAGTLLAL